MERAQDGLKTALGVTDGAANDDAVEGAGPAPAWDPYEVWRTRVKDVRDQRARAPLRSGEPVGPAGEGGHTRG